MIDLGSLVAKLVVDSGDGVRQLEDFGATTETTGGKVDGFTGKLKGLITGLAIGATIKAGVDIAVKAVNEFADKGDDIDKMSQKFGMSAEEYQRWTSIAGHNGTSIEAMGKSIKTITANLESNAQAYDNMGIAATNLDGSLRDSQDVFQDTILALSEMEAGTERDAKAKELLGGQYQELLPLINGGKDAILEQIDASANAVTMTDEQVAAAAAFKDAQQSMQEQMDKVKNTIVMELVPAFTSIMDWVSANMPAIQEVVGTVGDFIGATIGVIVELIKKLVENAQAEGTLFNAVWENIRTFIDTTLSGIRILFDAFVKLFNGDWEGFWDGIKEFLNTMLSGLVEIIINSGEFFLNAGKSIFNFLWDGVKQVWDDIKKWVDEKVSWLTDKLTFWKSSKSEMNDDSGNVDGSHRNGISYVPFDGYNAILHEGERVLTKAEAERLDASSKETVADEFNVYIEKVENKDGRTTEDLLEEMEAIRRAKRNGKGDV